MNNVTSILLGQNGRLGNQFFQIAACIAYALDNGKTFSFPPWAYNQYMQNQLPVAEQQNFITYAEPDFDYNSIPAIAGNVNLNGYYQSEKYFLAHKQAILKQFEFSNAVKDKCNNIIKLIRSTNRVNGLISVHFRFGDYVNNPFYAQLTETNYYKRACYLTDVRSSNPFYEGTPLHLVFSDDKQKAKEYMKKNITNNFLIIENTNDIEDLCLMGLCDSNIIANSSFSWWGAYLGKAKNVIAPNSWFSEKAGLNTKDLIPQNWMKL